MLKFEKKKSVARRLSSSLCNFLHSPVTPSLLGLNILLNTLFSNTLSICSSLNVSDVNVNVRYSWKYTAIPKRFVTVWCLSAEAVLLFGKMFSVLSSTANRKAATQNYGGGKALSTPPSTETLCFLVVRTRSHEVHIISKGNSIEKEKINFQQVNYIPKKKEGCILTLPLSTLLRCKQNRGGSVIYVCVWVVQDEAHHRWKNHHVYTGPPSF